MDKEKRALTPEEKEAVKKEAAYNFVKYFGAIHVGQYNLGRTRLSQGHIEKRPSFLDDEKELRRWALELRRLFGADEEVLRKVSTLEASKHGMWQLPDLAKNWNSKNIDKDFKNRAKEMGIGGVEIEVFKIGQEELVRRRTQAI